MADLLLIEEMRTHLVELGLVRPWNADAGTAPRIMLHPRDGAPEPRGQAYEDATVTLFRSNQLTRRPLEEFLEEAIVDVVVRAYRSQDAELIARRIRDAINGHELELWGELVVEWCRLWRGDHPIGSDETAYSREQSFRVASRVKSLAGMPYAT